MKNESRPRLIIVAGPNGSGKTTITENLLRHKWMEGCEYINPDYIAQEKFGNWNSPEASINAAIFAEKLRLNCLSEMKSMAFETVFSTEEKVSFVKLAKDRGYFVRLFFVCTNDPSINAQRVAQRVMEGGHDVPIPKIISRYYKSISNCVSVLPFVDRAYFYDNTVSGVDPKLLFRLADGKVARVYGEIDDWAKSIYESVLAK